jgi:hypothetical protein
VEEFEKLGEILYAELNICAGDGNDISVEIDGEDVILTFSFGWGDCPAGCI